ncbi:MAG: glutathione S-transferase family protein [Pseudomonadales bacterium]|nr:glutathione S-transferase family protein [Pseudomonadales bacterium]
MIKLHGVNRSNYYNMVKCAMLEKGIPFEEVLTPPSQEAEMLDRSAMGRIPFIETEKGYLAETPAILDYLEDIAPDTLLLPADPWERAKAKELFFTIKLNLELIARQGFGVLFGSEVPPSAIESMKLNLPKGIAAINRLARYQPWVCGENFTYTDLLFYFTLVYANRSAQANLGMDLFDELPGARAWFEATGSRDSVRKAIADQG